MRNPIYRSLVILAIVAGLVFPATQVQALPQFGYEINYYHYYPEYNAYGIVGSEYLYCWMYRPSSWGDISNHVCTDVKEVVDMNCSTEEWTYTYYYWDGIQWVQWWGGQMYCSA